MSLEWPPIHLWNHYPLIPTPLYEVIAECTKKNRLPPNPPCGTMSLCTAVAPPHYGTELVSPPQALCLYIYKENSMGLSPMGWGPIVTFTEEQVKEYQRIGLDRSRGKFDQSGMGKGKTSDDNHQIGAGGEMAAEIISGHSMNRKIYGAQGDGHSADVFNMEVKTRPVRGYAFGLFSLDVNEFQAEYGVLVYQLTINRFEIHRVISRENFLKRKKKANYEYGLRWVVEPWQMSPPSLLFDVEGWKKNHA